MKHKTIISILYFLNFFLVGFSQPASTAFSTAISSSTEKRIDSIVNYGIQQHIFPGCQVVAVYRGNTVFSKCYGYQTYDRRIPVTDTTLFDVASITKPAATTLAVMKLYDLKLIRLTDTIGFYLPYLRGTDKAKINLAELLTHTSGMVPYIPFYKSIASDTSYLSNKQTSTFSDKVADSLFLRHDYQDSLRARIALSPLGAKKYVYSDLNFFFLKEMVEAIVQKPMEEYLTEQFYRPMQLRHTCFNPLEHNFTKDDVAPTEEDSFFRHQKVEGYVHDQTAALFNGDAGNAGLFTTAYELSRILLLLMDEGEYAGQRYLSAETVRLFTAAFPLHQCNRRALGFDTPSFESPSAILPAAANFKTFGHQGFTGTVFWCDPDKQLIYVFFSNRVYPSTEPNKLSKSKIRLTVHDALYKGLFY